MTPHTKEKLDEKINQVNNIFLNILLISALNNRFFNFLSKTSKKNSLD